MNIPVEVFMNMESRKKNVLIISMSTLQKNSKTNYYYVKHKGESVPIFYSGKYSMEPGTKHVLYKLGKEGRKLDKIIMLSTPESRNESENENNANAVEYYKNEIKRFINEGDALKNYKEVDSLSESDKEILCNFITKVEGVSYSRIELEELFVEIPLLDMRNLSYEAIPKIVKEVLKIKEMGINLFLDMQGGSRVSTFIINAAVNMLQDDTIKLERSYATLYNRNNVVHQLRDESLSNHVFDMVSGMDEFLNYGRAKKFEEYFAYYKENYKKGEKLEEELIVETIDEISDAISICNVDGFYIGLNKLKPRIEVYKKLPSENKDAIFQAFVEKLEKTYEGILSENRRAIDVMEWCLEKEWYQQALTVCESKMPQQMVTEKVVYYCKSSKEKNKEVAKLNKYFREAKINKNAIKDTALFVVKNMKHYENDKKNKNLLYLIDKGELYSDYCTGADRERFKKTINGYDKLANMRNKVNHGNATDIRIENLKAAITEFINNYRELVQDNWKTNQLSVDCMITIAEINKCKENG